MLTSGIDLAAQPKFTAACLVSWGQVVQVDRPWLGLSDDDVLDVISKAHRTGIDVPLGWPVEFSSALARHAAGQRWPDLVIDRRFTNRATDWFVRQCVGIVPLSVAADKIAIPAMRAARLLSKLNPAVDRAGTGKVIEVYPAASLRSWGFPHRRYKRREGAGIRASLVERFLEETQTWISIDEDTRGALIKDDNAFDSLIAALTARAWAVGLARPVPEELREVAAIEGWIALPLPDSLSHLAGSSGG